MTVADFIDWPGDGTSTRYELVDGVLRAMAPGSDTHNTIVANLAGLLWQHLRQSRPECKWSPHSACSRTCARSGTSASIWA